MATPNDQVEFVGTVVANQAGTLVVLVGLRLAVYWVLTDDETIGVLDTIRVVGERVHQEVCPDSIEIVHKFDPHITQHH